jgi:glycosyltransferase involved in cell wall biosynthesis
MLVPHVFNSWRVSRAAKRLSPRFVFAHEVVAYGLAAARCGPVPRVLFPWGADIMTTAEVSSWHYRLVRHALRSADLIVPSSVVAARHVCARFGVDPSRVQAISWGADLSRCRRLTGDVRQEVCRQWGIAPDHQVVMNVRRFLPMYNCETAVAAFLDVAQLRPATHFVLLGGLETERFIETAVRKVHAHSQAVVDRFTFIRSNISLDACLALMGVADVAVSLCGRGDMRSKSVLDAAGCGGALVISDADEYRSMVPDGFAAEFVNPQDHTKVARVIATLLEQDELRADRAAQNARYLASHEDSDRQMDRLLEAVLAVAGHRTGH